MNINATLIGQAIWFALFIWITMKYVWPLLQKPMLARQKQIADGLAAAEEGKRALELSAKQADEEIAKARARAGEIIAQAEKRVSQMIEEAKSSAREEGDREKTAAKVEIAQEVSRAKEALRSQVSLLAIAGAEKILRREVDAKVHADLLQAVQAEL